MKEEGTLVITKEEHDLLLAALRAVPMQGTIETLPKGMEKVMGLMRKIQEAFEEREEVE